MAVEVAKPKLILEYCSKLFQYTNQRFHQFLCLTSSDDFLESNLHQCNEGCSTCC